MSSDKGLSLGEFLALLDEPVEDTEAVREANRICQERWERARANGFPDTEEKDLKKIFDYLLDAYLAGFGQGRKSSAE